MRALRWIEDQVEFSFLIPQWQKQQVKAYCQKYGLTKFKYRFPSDRTSKRRLFRRVIFDDNKKLLFTYVPKVCC